MSFSWSHLAVEWEEAAGNELTSSGRKAGGSSEGQSPGDQPYACVCVLGGKGAGVLTAWHGLPTARLPPDRT